MITGRAGWFAAVLIVLAVAPRLAVAEDVTIPVPGSTPIPAALQKPEGDGPFSAVVIAHDCSGLGPRSSHAPARWAKMLLGLGYVVLIPDSFSPRGHVGGICTEPVEGRRDVSIQQRAVDAYAALTYLRALPYVDGLHIGLMGGSHGGSTTLVAMERSAAVQAAPFAAAVALYPRCATPIGNWRVTGLKRPDGPYYAGVYAPAAPLLVLIGAKDDWTPADPCARLAAMSRAAGFPVETVVYPDAHHSFDSPAPERYVAERINPGAPGGRGATTGGNNAAWDDAILRVTAFFAAHLRAAP